MIDRLTLDAVKGDKDARELCLAYLNGKPVARVEHTGNEGGPLEVDIKAVLMAKLRLVTEGDTS
jgi:hypothetical protein